MPLTPYHWGPASWIGLVFRKWLILPVFLISAVIIDIEPGIVMFGGLNYPLHGFFHSFVGGTIAAIITALVFYSIRDLSSNAVQILGIKNKSFKIILLTSILGVYSHIIFDSPLYTDIKPFYPLPINPFYKLFSYDQIYSFCKISFVVGIILFFIMYRKKGAGSFKR